MRDADQVAAQASGCIHREAWQMRRRSVTVPNAREPGGNVALIWTLDGLMAPTIEYLIEEVVVRREEDDYPAA